MIHLPEEEMVAYNQLVYGFVDSSSPVGQVEVELVHYLADIQFRLNRLALAWRILFNLVERSLLAAGYEENDNLLTTGRVVSGTVVNIVERYRENYRHGQDGLERLLLDEERLWTAWEDTLNHIEQMLAERRTLEERDATNLRLLLPKEMSRPN
jgi:hypothetical protein